MSWPVAEQIDAPRVILESLRVEHADELFGLLDDAALHAYIGGDPLSRRELRARHERLVAGHSADGAEGWLNWAVRERHSGAAVGTVQATLTGREGALEASLAWVIGTAHQRQGYASEAAGEVIVWLRRRGARRFSARIHPEHRASSRVARKLGLAPTAQAVEGEIVWRAEWQ